MKCALIALIVFAFIVFGAGTPFIVYYRNAGVPETNATEPVGNGTTTNGTAATNGTRRALAACPDALLAAEGGDGTLTCTYASGACTYHSETGVLLDDQNGGSCPGGAGVKDRARKSRRGMRYEAIAKRVLA